MQVKDKLEFKSNPAFGMESDQFQLEIDHFSDCVMHNKKPYTPGEEGKQDQLVMEAIYESAKTGKMVRLTPVTQKDAFRGDAPKEQ
jgi:predicted dehydrogenase